MFQQKCGNLSDSAVAASNDHYVIVPVFCQMTIGQEVFVIFELQMIVAAVESGFDLEGQTIVPPAA